MKALLGKLGSLIKKDKLGKQGLKEFIVSGDSSKIITLESGKRYKIYTKT